METDPRYLSPAEVDILLGDASKARRELGWQPKVNLKELVRLMVDHDLELAREESITIQLSRISEKSALGKRLTFMYHRSVAEHNGPIAAGILLRRETTRRTVDIC